MLLKESDGNYRDYSFDLEYKVLSFSKDYENKKSNIIKKRKMPKEELN